MKAILLKFDLSGCNYSDNTIKEYIIKVSSAYIIGYILGHSLNKIEHGLTKYRKRFKKKHKI